MIALGSEAGPTVRHTGGIMNAAVQPSVTTATGVKGTASAGTGGGAASHLGLNPIFGDYINDYMSKGSALANLPFAPYEGDRFAGPSQLQQQAFQQAGSLTPSAGSGNPLFQAGAGMISTGAGAYNPSMVSSNPFFQGTQAGLGSLMGTVGAAGNYTPTTFSPGGVSASNVSVGLDAGDFGTVQKYMSPYQQAVNDVTKRRMQEEFAKQDMARKAGAVKAGAFGGSRFAIENSEALKNQNTQISDMDIQGMQRAYDAAQQALAGQRTAQLTADTANQGASLQASLENARQAMRAQELTEQSKQFGSNLKLNAANAGSGILSTLGNLTLAGTNADNQAGLNLANLGITAGGALAGIGDRINSNESTRFNEGLQALQAKTGLGALQNKFEQDPLDFGYSQWEQSLKDPYDKVKFQQGLMAGLPLSYSGSGSENPWLAALQGGLGTYGLLDQLFSGKKPG